MKYLILILSVAALWGCDSSTSPTTPDVPNSPSVRRYADAARTFEMRVADDGRWLVRPMQAEVDYPPYLHGETETPDEFQSVQDGWVLNVRRGLVGDTYRVNLSPINLWGHEIVLARLGEVEALADPPSTPSIARYKNGAGTAELRISNDGRWLFRPMQEDVEGLPYLHGDKAQGDYIYSYQGIWVIEAFRGTDATGDYWAVYLSKIYNGLIWDDRVYRFGE